MHNGTSAAMYNYYNDTFTIANTEYCFLTVSHRIKQRGFSSDEHYITTSRLDWLWSASIK